MTHYAVNRNRDIIFCLKEDGDTYSLRQVSVMGKENFDYIHQEQYDTFVKIWFDGQANKKLTKREYLILLTEFRENAKKEKNNIG